MALGHGLSLLSKNFPYSNTIAVLEIFLQILYKTDLIFRDQQGQIKKRLLS